MNQEELQAACDAGQPLIFGEGMPTVRVTTEGWNDETESWECGAVILLAPAADVKVTADPLPR